MSANDDEKQALDVLRSFAEMVALNLSMERHLSVVIAKLSDATWKALFACYPAWYELYSAPQDVLLARILKLQASQEYAREWEVGGDPVEQFQKAVSNNRVMGREVAAFRKEIEARSGPISLELEESEALEAGEELAIYRAMLAEIRARCFYGQGMHSLIAAGRRGNDKGYVRAVEIDSMVQSHPFVVERLSREALAGRTNFAAKLRKAAETGPSRRIDKDLHQLRYFLSVFQNAGQLERFSDSERYEFFCHELGLYPDTGENPKAALCTFIKRWQGSLVE